jgi:hypothetical protein
MLLMDKCGDDQLCTVTHVSEVCMPCPAHQQPARCCVSATGLASSVACVVLCSIFWNSISWVSMHLDEVSKIYQAAKTTLHQAPRPVPGQAEGVLQVTSPTASPAYSGVRKLRKGVHEPRFMPQYAVTNPLPCVLRACCISIRCSCTCPCCCCRQGGPAEPPEGQETLGCPVYSHPVSSWVQVQPHAAEHM